MAMIPEPGEFVQVLNVLGNHWLTVSNIGCGNNFTIRVFDSLRGRLPMSSKKVVADILQCQKKSITIYHHIRKRSDTGWSKRLRLICARFCHKFVPWQQPVQGVIQSGSNEGSFAAFSSRREALSVSLTREMQVAAEGWH